MPDDDKSGSNVTPETGEIRAQYDWISTPPSIAVVETVAIAADTSPEALDPLYHYVDPDAMDALFQHASQQEDASLELAFTYDGYSVTLEAAGDLVVTPDE